MKREVGVLMVEKWKAPTPIYMTRWWQIEILFINDCSTS